jgi:predicted amino acid racemase
MVEEAKGVIRCCDVSYNTEKSTILNLGTAALEEGTEHHVILTVEMGDMREGIMPEDLINAAALVVATPGLALKGIAANFACMSNVAPTARDMALLSQLADQIEGECGPYVALVSAGGSASVACALGRGATGRINNLRLGEAILLGIDPVSEQPIDGLHTDAFALFAEVIEVRLKPNSMPTRPSPREYGKLELVANIDQRSRAVLAVGRQDTDASGLVFPSGIGFIDATSDHTVVDTGKVNVSVGSEMKMRMNYSALMQAMNAPDVEKVVRHEPPVQGVFKDAERQPRLKLV